MTRDDQKKTLKKVMKYIKKYRVRVVMSLIFAAVTVITTLYLPILTGKSSSFPILLMDADKQLPIGFPESSNHHRNKSANHVSRH